VSSLNTAANVVITTVAAAAAPALTLCVDTGALSASVAADIGGIVAAVVAAWHGGAIWTARRQSPAVEPLP